MPAHSPSFSFSLFVSASMSPCFDLAISRWTRHICKSKAVPCEWVYNRWRTNAVWRPSVGCCVFSKIHKTFFANCCLLHSEMWWTVLKVWLNHWVVERTRFLCCWWQYSNVYVTTANLQNLLSDKGFLAKCVDYVALPGNRNWHTQLFYYCNQNYGVGFLFDLILFELIDIGLLFWINVNGEEIGELIELAELLDALF